MFQLEFIADLAFSVLFVILRGADVDKHKKALVKLAKIIRDRFPEEFNGTLRHLP